MPTIFNRGRVLGGTRCGEEIPRHARNDRGVVGAPSRCLPLSTHDPVVLTGSAAHEGVLAHGFNRGDAVRPQVAVSTRERCFAALSMTRLEGMPAPTLSFRASRGIPSPQRVSRHTPASIRKPRWPHGVFVPMANSTVGTPSGQYRSTARHERCLAAISMTRRRLSASGHAACHLLRAACCLPTAACSLLRATCPSGGRPC